MSRRLPIMLMAALLIAVAPRVADAQNFRHGSIGLQHRPSPTRQWSRLDFGATKFVVPPKVMPAFRSMFDPPLNESPWRHAEYRTTTVRHHSTVGVGFAPAPPPGPTDCANTPVRLLAHRTPGGVVIVAPCRGK